MTRASTFLVGIAVLAACRQGDGPVAPSDDPALSAAVTHFRDRVVIRELLVVENPCANEDVGLRLNQLFMIHEVSRRESSSTATSPSSTAAPGARGS